MLIHPQTELRTGTNYPPYLLFSRKLDRRLYCTVFVAVAATAADAVAVVVVVDDGIPPLLRRDVVLLLWPLCILA